MSDRPTVTVRTMVGRGGEWINKGDLMRYLKWCADNTDTDTARVIEELIINISTGKTTE